MLVRLRHARERVGRISRTGRKMRIRLGSQTNIIVQANAFIRGRRVRIVVEQRFARLEQVQTRLRTTERVLLDKRVVRDARLRVELKIVSVCRPFGRLKPRRGQDGRVEALRATHIAERFLKPVLLNARKSASEYFVARDLAFAVWVLLFGSSRVKSKLLERVHIELAYRVGHVCVCKGRYHMVNVALSIASNKVHAVPLLLLLFGYLDDRLRARLDRRLGHSGDYVRG